MTLATSVIPADKTTTPESANYFIEKMPIFSAGVRDGIYYSVEDIDDTVSNFELSYRTWTPAAGLGHYGDGASLLGDLERTQTKPCVSFQRVPLIWPNLHKLGCTGTAEPAVGWITKLWRVGRTLWAEVRDIPACVASMIKSKMFRYVSAEIYQEPPDGVPGKGCFLHGIGFLGKMPPEVKTLGEVPSPAPQDDSSLSHGVNRLANAFSGKGVPISIVSRMPRVHVFSEVKTMDLNQLATDLKLSPDAVKALGTLNPTDQDLIKSALEKGKTADQVAAAPPTANAEITPEIAALSRDDVIAKLAELGQVSDDFATMSDDELKQMLAEVVTGEADAFDDIQVPADIAAMTREAVVAELVALGEDATTLGDLTDDDLKRLLAELKAPAANSEGDASMTEEEKKKEDEEAKANAAKANAAKAHSQGKAKPGNASGSANARPKLRVFSEQHVEQVVKQRVDEALAGVGGTLKSLQESARREAALHRRREIKMRDARINAFCERGIKERKILPYELAEDRKDAQGRVIPSLKTILRQAFSQVMAFSEGGKTVKTNLAAQIMRFINNRKPVAFSEIIPGGGGDSNAGSAMSPERRRELLSYTGVGMQILNKEAAAKTSGSPY